MTCWPLLDIREQNPQNWRASIYYRLQATEDREDRSPRARKSSDRSLLDASRGHPWLYVLLLVASATGCRRGELLAPTWPGINFTSGMMAVSKSLEQTATGLRVKAAKSERSRRINLPATAIDALKDHRKAQKQLRCVRWRFPYELGSCLRLPGGRIRKARICDGEGLSRCPAMRPQGSGFVFASTYPRQPATRCRRVPPGCVKRLGHSSVDTTAKVYAHISAPMTPTPHRLGKPTSPKPSSLAALWWLHMAARSQPNKF